MLLYPLPPNKVTFVLKSAFRNYVEKTKLKIQPVFIIVGFVSSR
jgi:hypothetical protein